MNTKDSMIVSVHTEDAINRLKDYLHTTIFSNANVELRDDMLFISIAEGTVPTSDLIEEIKKIFYWTDQISVPNIDGFVHYYNSTNSLLVNLSHYEEICKIREKLATFGAELKSIDISFHEYMFTYDVPGRSNLNYYELLEIERIVEPSQKETLDHLSVFRMDVFYTITIKHVSWKY